VKSQATILSLCNARESRGPAPFNVIAIRTINASISSNRFSLAAAFRAAWRSFSVVAILSSKRINTRWVCHNVSTGVAGLKEKMKIQTLLLSLAALSVWTASAQVNIPILNPRFNVDVLSGSPGASQYGITGWITGPYTGVLKASTTQYPGAPTTGFYCAYLGGTATSGSILQTLGTTVQANTTYTLILEVGARADEVFTGYAASLLAGNVLLASGHKATPVGGTFVTEVVVYESGATPAQLGQPLQILITSKGDGQVNISGVSLTAN
jgi:hypothetical protein